MRDDAARWPGFVLFATLVLVCFVACKSEVTESQSPPTLGPEELCPLICNPADNEPWCYERFEGPPECDAFAQKFIECEVSLGTCDSAPSFAECFTGRYENFACVNGGCGPVTCGAIADGCPCEQECDVGRVTSECVMTPEGVYECSCYLDGETVCRSRPGSTLDSCGDALSACSAYFSGSC